MSTTAVNGTITFQSNGNSPVILREVAEMVEGFQRLQLPVAVTITVMLDGEMAMPTPPMPAIKEAAVAPANFPAPVPDADGVNGQSMIVLRRKTFEWGELSENASDAVTALENDETTWRRIRKDIRLELVQAVLAQPTESGRPMTTGQFDQVRPAWMSKAGNLTTMFGCAWSELPGLRLSE